jgi:hypothetical protein
MTDAALTEDSNMPPLDAEPATTEAPEASQTESAPAAQVEAPAEPQEETLTDRGQERFNKITADKYKEKRRADAAEQELKDLRAQAPAAPVASDKPLRLEDFDFDEGKLQAAQIERQVDQRFAAMQTQQQAAQVQQRAEDTANAFTAKAADFAANVPDYQEAIGQIPELPPETLNAVMQSENGPALAYHLAKHLDVADEIANMPPMAAAMRLGEISVSLKATKPQIKPSAAPAPIEPLSSGGSISKDVGDMSMEEIMRL